jgi:hypothetical protein
MLPRRAAGGIESAPASRDEAKQTVPPPAPRRRAASALDIAALVRETLEHMDDSVPRQFARPPMESWETVNPDSVELLPAAPRASEQLPPAARTSPPPPLRLVPAPPQSSPIPAAGPSPDDVWADLGA